MGIFWQIIKIQSNEFSQKKFFKNLFAVLQNIVDMIAHLLLVNLPIFCHETASPLNKDKEKNQHQNKMTPCLRLQKHARSDDALSSALPALPRGLLFPRFWLLHHASTDMIWRVMLRCCVNIVEAFHGQTATNA